MSALHEEMGLLSQRLAELKARLGEVASQHAEISADMLPFAARLQKEVLRFHDALVAMQREIADLKAMQGMSDALDAGDVQSPLKRFLPQSGPLSVQEQYDRVWRGKTVPKYAGPDMPPASKELKQHYAEVVAAYHPDLAQSPAERGKRSEEMERANTAYVRRDQITLHGMAMLVSNRSNLPAIVDERVVRQLREQAHAMEQLIGKLEAQTAEMMYGDVARIRAYADVAKADGQDLIAELSSEIQADLRRTRDELIALKGNA